MTRLLLQSLLQEFVDLLPALWFHKTADERSIRSYDAGKKSMMICGTFM